MKGWTGAALAAAGLLTGSVTGCAAHYPYDRPSLQPDSLAVRVYDRPADDVWRALIGYVGDNLFMVDNLQKDSYFLNASFSASDPSAYVDCGVMHLQGGKKPVDLHLAEGVQRVKFKNGEGSVSINGSASLSGKMNVFAQQIDPTHTRLKVNARYIFARQEYAGSNVVKTDLTFDTTQPASSTQPEMTCASRFTLERSILDGVARRLEGAGAR